MTIKRIRKKWGEVAAARHFRL